MPSPNLYDAFDKEWAAKCLWQPYAAEFPGSRWEHTDAWVRDGMRRVAHHAIANGYRPPPKPPTAREALIEVIKSGAAAIMASMANKPGMYRSIDVEGAVDEFLDQFDVKRKGE